MALLTVGHSTRSFEEFVELLRAHGVRCLVDVRRFPRSRAHPQFNKAALARRLPARGIAYRHVEALGGRRAPAADSPNAGWRNRSFRGYADYMSTSDFREALASLRTLARRKRTAILCAEALPWRCHRWLLSDALLAEGVEVEHILGSSAARPHRMSAFARRRGGTLTYPA
jgi:uncharacterized protein (DUF488 family)